MGVHCLFTTLAVMFDFANTFPPEMAFSSSQPSVKDFAERISASIVHRLIPNEANAERPKAKAEAKANRALEFTRGRRCADAALIELGCHLPSSARTVGVHDDRSPKWPRGFVGSISHSCNWTWAAVAKRSEVTAIGIDTEPVMTSETMQQVIREIASQAEWERVHSNSDLESWTPEEKTTLVFSVKEAFYKCWFPLHRKYFGFQDAVIDQIGSRRIRIRNGSSSPNIDKGPEFLDVFYYRTAHDIFSFTWMPKE